MDSMELAMSHIANLDGDRLRSVIAHAAGLHAHKHGTASTLVAMRRVMDALQEQCTTFRMENIAWQVAFEHSLTLDDLRSRDCHHYIAHARQEAMYRMSLILRADGLRRYSYPQIAKFFGMHHTTILHGVRQAARRKAKEQRALAA